MLTLSQVSRVFGTVRAVDNVSAQIEPGRIFGILGPNGSGKTTTLRMIMGIYEPSAGTIEYEGARLADSGVRVGYLPEERGVYPRMPLGRQLLYFAGLRGCDRATAERRSDALTERLGIREYRQQTPTETSKGIVQRFQFAIAIIHDPEIVVLDEAFSGLDPISVDVLNACIAELSLQGKTVIISSHRLEQVDRLCDDILLLNKGRVLLSGGIRDVKNRWPERLVQVQPCPPQEFIQAYDGVRIVSRTGSGEGILAIGKHVDPADLMLRMRQAVSLTTFDVRDASLHDIYVSALTKDAA